MKKKGKIEELIIDNQALALKIFIAQQDLADELIERKIEFSFLNEDKKTQIKKLVAANKLMSEELVLASKELAFQDKEKQKRAAELEIANKELAFQDKEKQKRATELEIANKELAFQNEEKQKRATELEIANKELAFQNKEKQKRAAELEIANKELAFQNKEKVRRLEELSIANNNLEQFAYIASHDLKEPLRTISNFIQVFEEDYLSQLDENAQKYIQIIKDASKRMDLLIKSLLDFSQLGFNLKLTEVDCNQLLEDVTSDLQATIKTSNAVIEVAEMPKLNLYEPEFRRLFQNLIINAIKYQKKDNQLKIRIRSEKMNEIWKFSITDNGIGIAPAHFEKIFNMFQRIHSNESMYEGRGIGLATCKKIVQMHLGEIWIESELGKGTTFYFTVPIRPL